MMIDLQWRTDKALADVGDRHVLDVAHPRRQRQVRDIALGLSLDVEVDGALQSAACARNLREADSGRE